MNMDLVFVWTPDKDLDCTFHDIFTDKFKSLDLPPNIAPARSVSSHRPVYDINPEKDVFVKGFHFFFILQDFNETKENISLDYIKAWNRMIFSEKFNLRRQVQHFDLGIHIRRSSQLDTQDWGKPDLNTIVKIISHVLISKKEYINSIYVSSTNDMDRKSVVTFLKQHHYDVLESGTNFFSNDLMSCLDAFCDFFYLLNCKVIIRRDISTFAALAALLNASEEVLYSEDGAIVIRKPLILSGLAL
ncbi:MAG: hypothetical protein VKL39_14485 [Leptolyngbyaceae bacterium]|nr:hypothetical protein [Leptolyngbyaceae bacterium]